LKGKTATSLEEELLFIANAVGSELLATPYPNRDLFSIWSCLSPSERIDAFKEWFREDGTTRSFLLIDDIDAASPASIQATLPHQARNLLITTRNPTMIHELAEEHRLEFYDLLLTGLATEYLSTIIARRLAVFRNHEHSCSNDSIRAISEIAAGHPLVASRIASYIATNLTEQYGPRAVEEFVSLSSEYYRLPLPVFKHKPTFQLSIEEVFEISRNRLSSEHSWILMQLIAFLVQDHPDFIQLFLFHACPWINEYPELTFYPILSANADAKQSWLSDLRRVSFGTARSPSDYRLHFHPILIQYIQEHVEDRVKIVRAIMFLALETIERNQLSPFAETSEQHSTFNMLYTQALDCARLCKAYNISPEKLDLGPRSDDLFQMLHG
jgi:hypothetical protein